MSARLEEMLRIARAADDGRPWVWRKVEADGSVVEHSLHGPTATLCRYWHDRPIPPDAQHIATFNPRTAEALVKVALAAKVILSKNDDGFWAGYAPLREALSALTAAMEDSSNVG